MAEPQLFSLPRYPVRLVAQRTGLTPHLLRAWERRYHVVAPTRSEGGHRLYSDLDIERLRRLRRLTDRGHTIGQIAQLPLDKLVDLERSAARESGADRVEEAVQSETARAAVRAALRAARRYDAGELQSVLERTAVTHGVPAFLEDVVANVVEQIGHGWSEGSVSVAQEHLATAVVRRVLGWLLGVYQTDAPTRHLLVATPAGQVHELGAMMAAVSASAEGWKVTYLGPDVPAEDLVNAARETDADAVALSIVRPDDSGAQVEWLRAVRESLPDHVSLVVGGASALGVQGVSEELGIRVVSSLAEFRLLLHQNDGDEE